MMTTTMAIENKRTILRVDGIFVVGGCYDEFFGVNVVFTPQYCMFPYRGR